MATQQVLKHMKLSNEDILQGIGILEAGSGLDTTQVVASPLSKCK